MSSRKLMTVLFVFFLFGNISFAQEHSASELAQTYMEKSGLREQTALLVQQIGAAFTKGPKEPGQSEMPPDITAVLNKTVAQTFQAGSINNTLQHYIATRLVPAEMKKVLAWLDTPLGKKIIALELASLSPEFHSNQPDNAREKTNAPGMPDRINLLLRLDKATKTTKFAVDLQMNMQITMLTAAYSSMAFDKEFIAQLKDSLEENRFQIEGVLSQQLLIGSLNTYKDLTNAELEEYIVFNQTGHASHLNNIVQDGLQDIFIQSSTKLGEKMAALFKTKNSEVKER